MDEAIKGLNREKELLTRMMSYAGGQRMDDITTRLTKIDKQIINLLASLPAVRKPD